jgi:aryl sulfotransferase
MGGIIWLASYPKSGNTWFRIFLANLQGKEEGPAHINDLQGTPIASARGIFDDEAGIEASDLTMNEIDQLRPLIYEQLAANADETLFMKVHDAYTFVDDNKPLFPEKATRGVIYVMRNPLDVSISFAHHLGCDYDTSILRMADENLAFYSNPKGLHSQLRQRLLSWSSHVKSWTELAPPPVFVLRYEDMKQKSMEVFEKAVRFSGLKYGRERVMKALDSSSFAKLQRQEKMTGFREKSPNSQLFFRKGEIGAWREELTEKQAKKVIDDHRAIMRRFGYLGPNDEIVF